METSDFDYDLPHAAIAQRPIEPRDASRLLVDRGPEQRSEHRTVRDLPALIGPGDVVVVNETRVRPARLLLEKRTGGHVEVLLIEREASGDWLALVRPGRRVPPGTVLQHGDRRVLEVLDDLGDGRRRARFAKHTDAETVLAALGEVPLPPYITEPLADPERYQTVFARAATSSAAPTAGLHLTERVLAGLDAAGAAIVPLDLAIGLDTFRPIATAKLEDHSMHSERYTVPEDSWAAVEHADRVVAIGTTVARALESVAATGRLEGRTELFIHGEHRWRAVDALLTNFHLPRTTLLAMVASFIGSRWRDLYVEALGDGYRFLSFGDAMFLPSRGLGR